MATTETRIATITTERVERKLEQIEVSLKQYENGIQAMSRNKPEGPYKGLLDRFSQFNNSFAEVQQFWRMSPKEREEIKAESTLEQSKGAELS